MRTIVFRCIILLAVALAPSRAAELPAAPQERHPSQVASPDRNRSSASERSPAPLRPDPAPLLAPLLVDDRGKAITTPAAWLKQRAALRRRWLAVMGEFTSVKAPLKTEILSTENLPGFTRQRVKYQIEDGVCTDGYLLTPKYAVGKLPAMVVFHPTIATHTAQVAGVDGSNPEKMQGVQLVRRGYVVLCPRCFIFDDGADYAGNVRKMQTRHPRWTGMARMTRDGMRAADFLQSLPNVDRRRIGCIGHSLGAKEAMYAAAFDERYQVAVFSEGGIGLKFSNWDDIWYLGPGIKQPNFELEHHQVMSLIAPRAFLLLAGDSADNERSRAFVEAVRPVYRLLGRGVNLGWFDHHLGHRYPPAAEVVAEAFIDHCLKR
jgi:dienelactone hydrolase